MAGLAQDEVTLIHVDPSLPCRGIGRPLMAETELRLRQRAGPKINLQTRRDKREAIACYERIGFREDPVVSFGKRLEHDR